MQSANVQARADGGISAEELMERAHAVLPLVRAESQTGRERGDVSETVVAAIKDAGLFRAYQPHRWGGMELDPRIMLDIQNAFAAVDLSTAWIYGVLSVQSFMLGRMDVHAQADVWEKTPDALISSSFAPVGKVTAVEGGYRISGRFTFSSGSSHADWAMVGGMVPPDDARPTPQMRLFLVPRSDYAIDRVWDTIGLRATGSNDLVMEDVYVPAYRTMVPDAGIAPLPSSSGLSAFYRLPWLYMFATTISNIGVGCGRGALDIFTEVTRTRKSGFGNAPCRENPVYVGLIGRARAEIELIDAQAKVNYATLIDIVARDAALPMEQAFLLRSQLTSGLRKIATLVDEMQLLMGGRGIASDGPLTAVWLDMMAARAHAGNDPSAVYAQLAGQMLDAE